METPRVVVDLGSEEEQKPYEASWPPPPSNTPLISHGPILPVFSSVLKLSKAIIIMLCLSASISAIGLVGALLPQATAARQTGIAILEAVQTLLMLAYGICFLIWMCRMNKNVRSFGITGLRYTPVWCVASFFIPILSFYRPFQVLREIWQASDPTAPNDPTAPGEKTAPNEKTWRNIKPPILLGFWWASFLLMNVVDALSINSSGTTDIDVADAAVNLMTALIAVQLVRLFTARQEKTAKRMFST